MANTHQFEIIVRSTSGHEIRFGHVNHDDVLEIAARVKVGSGLTPDDAAALAIGLKLLAEVAMPRRGTAPYDALWPALAVFTRSWKASVAARADSSRTALA